MDEIKTVLLIGPFQCHVIHLEHAVGWDPDGLNGREVGADDLGVGERFCHLNGPYSCSRTDIEDPFGIVVYGGKVELIFQGKAPGVVGNVLLIVVGLIVGTPVGTIAVGVISTTIFPSVTRIGGFEGVGNRSVQGSGVVVGRVGVGGGFTETDIIVGFVGRRRMRMALEVLLLVG